MSPSATEFGARIGVGDLWLRVHTIFDICVDSIRAVDFGVS